IEARHAARVATFEPAQLVQPLHSEDVGSHDRAVQQDNHADTSVREALAEGCHRVLCGRRFGQGSWSNLTNGESLAGILARHLVVLKAVFERHGRVTYSM